VNVDDDVAEAGEAILEGPVLAAISAAIGHDPDRDFDVQDTPRNDDEAATRELVVNAYVVRNVYRLLFDGAGGFVRHWIIDDGAYCADW
jgi:hypothetical protein